MKIAVYHNLPSGGAKRAMHEMIRRLYNNHQIEVYSLSCADHNFCDLRPFSQKHTVFPFKPMPLLRSPFGRLNQLGRTMDLFRVRQLQRQIARQIDAGGYDLVYVNDCMFGQSPALLSFLKSPSLHFCNEIPRQQYEPRIKRPYYRESRLRKAVNQVDPLPGFYSYVYKSIDRANMLASTRVLTNSAFTRENIYRTYQLSAQVLYLGVDSQHFHPLGLPKKNYVLSVGATTPAKGYDFLIESLAQIPSAIRPPLVIISNSAEPLEYLYLTKMAAQLGVSVEFRQMVTDSELVQAYNQAAMTVYSPIMEPFGFTPLESMACGTPVVGVAEGGVRESIQDGITGLLTDRSPAQFAQAVRNLLADPALRDEYGRNGRRQAAEKWSWERTINNLENHIQEVARR